MTGPVGIRGADRWRLFRYQLYSATVERLLESAPRLPSHTWGRRAAGTTEMWTSDSATSWLLARSGIDLSQITLPEDGRAPGWKAGAEVLAGSRR